MSFKHLLLFVLLIFLIAETTLVGSEKIFQQKLGAISLNQSPLASPSLSWEELRSRDLILSWDHGKQKNRIPLASLLIPFQRVYLGQESVRLDFEKLTALLEALAPEVNQSPVKARLSFSENKQKVSEFSLSTIGQDLNVNQSAKLIANSLLMGNLSVPLIVEEVPPAISSSSLSQLGINTLLGKGESDFEGSSISRIKNIRLGAEKFQGLLVPPQGEFSFNKILGEVNEKSGFLPELVIKKGRVASEYGGGLCQVSTTLFRAAVFAGLPILERRPHYFPVHYYSPQGFDATIYPGVSDLKFQNDTEHYLLIQSKIEGHKLAFEIFGSANGRRVVVNGPHQYDQKSSGALKAILTRKIYYQDRPTKEEKFLSSYRPPPRSPLEKTPLE